jgi:nucleoid-associated protein YgaU
MPTGRWKKLAIAGAILIIGIGTALLFRREQASDAGLAAKAPESLRQPAANRAAASQKSAAQPALAGRIEPYSPAAQPELVQSASSTFTRSIDNTNKPDTKTDSPLKWQTVERPGNPNAFSSGQLDRTTVDRFADDADNRATPVRRPAVDKRHKIVDGDTLAALARRYLGGEQRSLELFEYNRDVLVTPELLPIGKELRIPHRDFMPAGAPSVEPESRGLTAVAVPVFLPQSRESAASTLPISAAVTAAKPPTQTYFVQQHDTLALIARKLYGDISRQGDLLAANRCQLRSAKDLRPGMTLVVPAAPARDHMYDGLPKPSKW